MMRRRVFSVICLTLLVLLLGTACSSNGDSFEQQNAEIRALLPEREGYRWVYHGFAEYGHTMTLDGVAAGQDDTVYHVSGMVDDPSGGEAPGPFDFTIEYVVGQGRLLRKLSQGARLLDNKFLQLELVRAPLEQGNSWEQTAIDAEGNEVTVETTIKAVSQEDGKAVYVVRYEDESGYWEERTLREGVGVVSLERVFEEFTIGYALYEEASGYPEE